MKSALTYFGSIVFWVVFCLIAFVLPVQAAPTLTSSSYGVATIQPTSATLSVDGTSTIVCTVPKAADGSVAAVCDLATVAAGTHTLVLTVANTYGCTQSADGLSASCVGGGSASAAPFTFSWNPSAVSKPTLTFKQ